MTTNAVQEQRMIRAKTWIILNEPFFATLLLRLKMEQDPTCNTAWVDGKNMGWNPDFIAAQDDEQLRGLLVHEIMHVVNKHHIRRGLRNPKKWNRAGDHVINISLLDLGFKLPDNGLWDEQYANMTTDHVYNLLPDEPQDDESGGWGEVRDAKNEDGSELSPSQVSEAEQKVNIAVQQALTTAKKQGKLPGALQRLAEDLVSPQVPWQDILRAFMTKPIRDDYSWSRANRRHIGEDLFLPANYSEGLGEIVIAVDTSGSITANELNHFSSEINAIIDDAKPEKVHVVYCDTRVQHTEEFDADDYPVKLKMHGGGGTHFDPPFKWIEEQQIDVAAFVYLTDLWGDCTVPEPWYPALWVCTSTCTNYPFGQLTFLDIK